MSRQISPVTLRRVDNQRLQSWIIHADWRQDDRPYLIVDLDHWPDDLAIETLPPVPVIGIGPQQHPLANRLDVIVEPKISLSLVTRAIVRHPQASATLVQLLRATEDMPLEPALTIESVAFAMLQAGAEHRAWRTAQTPGDPVPPGTVDVSHDGTTLKVLLNRPQARNAIDCSMRDGLFDAFCIAAIDPDIREVRLRGAGRCFSSGADLAEFGTTLDPTEAHAIRMRTLPARALIRRPEIYTAHIQGGCVGSGLELAAFARLITASRDAWFQLPEISMGILPGAGGCVSIPRRTGRQHAALLMLSGQRIGVGTALRWGLIDAIVDNDSSDQD